MSATRAAENCDHSLFFVHMANVSLLIYSVNYMSRDNIFDEHIDVESADKCGRAEFTSTFVPLV